MPDSAYLELLDWRRRVSELFAALRQREPTADTLQWFRAQKDALFRDHPQSPIPPGDRPSFPGLPYWSFDPQARVTAHFTEQEEESPPAAAEVAFKRIGRLDFSYQGQQLSLGAFWIEGYAGGLFVPFKDGTSGHESYGGGRYLLDTIKSADLGSDARSDTVVLDFNYAYHPSCTYDPRWVCPLAPPDSRLAIPIRAGERLGPP
ncbi:MAG: DUF1684 domain-containing protein [Chloroflexi bacterium]|nr:MAG: DUF1684 domain-containing protein [Chloroflexota bacterium]